MQTRAVMHTLTRMDLQALVDAADDAALLRAVDGLAAGRQWDALADLARRCRDAVESGRQLWGVAMHIDYRLAWEGPPEYAAAVVRPGAGRFTPGPLSEVAAATHDWASLAPHLTDLPSRAAVAQERVLRGEDLTTDPAAAAGRELPLRLARWEPSYALPTYRDRSAEFPQPEVATRQTPRLRQHVPRPAIEGNPVATALESVVEPWATESSGRVTAVAVDGGAGDAVATLHHPPAGGDGGSGTPVQAALLPVTPADGLALLQWAGASGGAHGRRRGGAAGRFSAWWATAALCDLDWPADPANLEEFAGELGDAVAELRWYRWRSPAPETGWVLRLAVEDPAEDMAWAIDAVDRRDEEA